MKFKLKSVLLIDEDNLPKTFVSIIKEEPRCTAQVHIDLCRQEVLSHFLAKKESDTSAYTNADLIFPDINTLTNSPDPDIKPRANRISGIPRFETNIPNRRKVKPDTSPAFSALFLMPR